MSGSETRSLFERTGAYLRGHFRLTSGLHSEAYVQCARVLAWPRYAEQLGRALAAKLAYLIGGSGVQLVAAPAMGGLIIGHEVARALDSRFLFTERDSASGQMLLRRGFTVSRGERAVVVEDVITTGGSTREVVRLLTQAGVEVLAAAAIIDRSDGRAEVGVPLAALDRLQVTTYPPERCPLCLEGVPVVKPGSRPG